MLTSWLETRPVLWLEPLKMASRLTPISSNTASSSGASTWAVNRWPMRLISRGVATDFLQLDRRRLLAEQIVIEHLARDWRRRGGAEAGVLDQHGECNFRILGRR